MAGSVLINPKLGVQELATDTGGTLTGSSATDGFGLGEAFTAIVKDLRKQYRLQFVPAAFDGQFHTLEVRAKREGLFVGVQRSVLVPSGSDDASPEFTRR